ncbi:MAG: hypothetical protein ACHREM_07840 [Polyangiales bacterium]
MRVRPSTFLGITLLAIGCGGTTSSYEGPSAATSPSTSTAEARLVATMTGDGSATLRLTATDVSGHAPTMQRDVLIHGDVASIIDPDLPPSRYSFHVELLDATHGNVIGAVSDDVEVGAGTTVDIELKGDLGVGQAANLSFDVDAPPVIRGVDVLIGGGDPDDRARLIVHVTAVDVDGGKLRYLWSGIGTAQPVDAGPTLKLDAAEIAALATTRTVHLVVVDDGGSSTEVDVLFSASLLASVSRGVTVEESDGGGVRDMIAR